MLRINSGFSPSNFQRFYSSGRHQLLYCTKSLMLFSSLQITACFFHVFFLFSFFLSFINLLCFIFFIKNMKFFKKKFLSFLPSFLLIFKIFKHYLPCFWYHHTILKSQVILAEIASSFSFFFSIPLTTTKRYKIWKRKEKKMSTFR